MATLCELGYRNPVVQEGQRVDIEDASILPGDIAEFYLVPDGVITQEQVWAVATQVAKIKEQYPYCVLHYLKITPTLVTVQFSVSPPDTTNAGIVPSNPGFVLILIAIAIAALIALKIWIDLHPRQFAYFVPWIKTSSIGVSAYKCFDPDYIELVDFPGAPFRIQRDGIIDEEYETPYAIGMLPLGVYTITWGDVSGFYTPVGKNVTLTEEPKLISEVYYDENITPPTYGWLTVDASPVKDKVIIAGPSYPNGEEFTLPVTRLELSVGQYTISFSDIEGYDTPATQTVSMTSGGPETVTGRYTKPGEGLPSWAKGAIAIGATALAVGISLRLIPRRGGKE